MKKLIDKLEQQQTLIHDEFLVLLSNRDAKTASYLFSRAQVVREKVYGNKVFMRGLIEFSSFCKNDCYYCGLRWSNREADRYRLTKEHILTCCTNGYDLGFRTFVLQGGEDPYYNDEKITDLIISIKKIHPDCAVTLSIGEMSRQSYQAFFDAGADRYLLRHETINDAHYRKLHPSDMTSKSRRHCLHDLKEIGYQVGCGFMVGSPYQTMDNLINDLIFLREFDPQMVGVGPFIPHHATPFADQSAGSLELTLFLLGIIRLMLPNVLLPTTTALGTIDPQGREKGILAGANVVMPNLSPVDVRNKYLLYDNKICTGDEAAECLTSLEQSIETTGCRLVIDRGDYKKNK
ncbi:[FeFe] hydrogenase H-cluster radical SAM maturase HydE [Eubacteriaceae bacterium ES3]|nr:[FeFe] hydrogenase H-cluster radical SAM maturase HydE [Eubacteriaceae bacterium ES3]